MNDAEDIDPFKISWAAFLAITSFCSLLFSFFLKLMDVEHAIFYLKAGVASAVASFLFMLFKKLGLFT